ncbi:MAG: phosphoribosylformylglycinamidine cyclo-ligase [Elusimicrobiota bacterium]
MNLNYKKSGVDVDKAEKIAEDLKKRFPSIGGYAGLYKLGEYTLASTCDGVGTKILIAKEFNCHEVVGEDLVAMNVNDLIAGGAKPLFFMDYFSTGNLDKKIFSKVMKGIETGIEKAKCVLLGGETAEMPGMYGKDEYDLAGFSCGILIKKLKQDSIKKGDVIIGLKSNGIHSNGFSLVRKVLSKDDIKNNLDIIMKPTKIYSEVAELLSKKDTVSDSIKSIAHVTGGGINRALHRLLPKKMKAKINEYQTLQIFKIISERGISSEEMKKVFNMGWGMLLVADKKEGDTVSEVLNGQIIGEVD